MAAKKRTKRSKPMESESPVTTPEVSPTKQPPKKKQKSSRKNAMKKLKIRDINGRMLTTGTCEVTGIVIACTGVQERFGKYGRYHVSQCTLLDEFGNSIDVKSYKEQAASDADKYQKHREVQVVFETKNIVRNELRYNCAANKYHIRNPSRITMTPTSVSKTLNTMVFENETIETVKDLATHGAMKKHLSGIITEINKKEFNGKEGLMFRVNDATASQMHIFYEIPGKNVGLVQEGEFIFIWNATIQKKDNYINSDGGVCLDVNVFKSLKKQEKTMKKMLEQDEMYRWSPKKYDFADFTPISIEKIKSLWRRCRREEEFELKDKYHEIVLQDVEIEDFENLSTSTYLSAKADAKHKKLSEEELAEMSPNHVEHNWMLKVVISNGIEEYRITLFNSMGDKLMKTSAQDWQKSSESKKQKIIETIFKAKFDVYLTLQKKEYQGRMELKTNVVNLNASI